MYNRSIFGLIKHQQRQPELLSYWSEAVFTYKISVTLTFDLLNNMGYLLDKTNAPVKFESSGLMNC
jgi:hypothetical protein